MSPSKTLQKPDGPAVGGFERRALTVADLEVRAVGEDGTIGFTGHAAMFERRTWIGPKKWGFWEQVARGAFSKSISESDVRFLINHDPNLVLARNKANTLTLAEDEQGLRTDADMAPTTYALDLAISMGRGDISQMSFAFEVVRESWETLGDETELRTIEEAKLWDVSVVTYPAYDDTDASLRSVAFDVLCTRLGISTTKRSRLITSLAHEGDMDPDVLPILRDASRTLASLTEDPAPAESTQAPGEPNDHAPAESTRGVPLSVLRLRHDRKEKDGFTAA